jgi:hypothetical protein
VTATASCGSRRVTGPFHNDWVCPERLLVLWQDSEVSAFCCTRGALVQQKHDPIARTILGIIPRERDTRLAALPAGRCFDIRGIHGAEGTHKPCTR